MAYLVHANESGRVEIRESGEPDALPLPRAFRKAKVLAGWEVPYHAVDGLQETGLAAFPVERASRA